MSDTRLSDSLSTTVSAARRRLFTHAFLAWWIRAGVAGLLLAAVLVAVDQRWGTGAWSVPGSAVILTGSALIALGAAAWGLGSRFRSALRLDEEAGLKDRISSALEFLRLPELSEAQSVQLRDAADHAAGIDLRKVLRPLLPRYGLLLPVLALLFALSFLVPSKLNPEVEAAVDQERLLQAEELSALAAELEEELLDEEELAEVVERLKEAERRFEQGEMGERELMIELARMDESLRRKMMEMGVEKLDGQIGQLIPQLMANQASRKVAQALKQEEFDEAAKEMEKLAEKVGKDDVSKEDQEKLAMNMGVAASKLGGDSQGSFGGDLQEASESLKAGDKQAFSKAGQRMGQKFKNVGKYRNLKSSRKRISLAKASMGQLGKKACRACQGKGCKLCQGKKACGQCKGQGCAMCNGTGKGGLKAGTGTTGDPFGDPKRLADSFRQLLKIDGMAGAGPVDSEVEVTEGQLSESQRGTKDLYAEYAEVAEQAIEREEIPLSHRFHVKRYFQAIRPSE